jgi:SWI/SNF-related matrix-associated actin-dependent regulator 1 of chromatin subfamily A
LDLAGQLRLEIAAELLNNGHSREVEAILERARTSGAYPFQMEGIEWLTLGKDRLLTDDMGCGKTVQVLLALPDNARCLAVVPASVKHNWADECKTWRPDLTPVVLKGKKSFRWPKDGELVIVNPDILPGWMSKTKKKVEKERFLGVGEASDFSAPDGMVLVEEESCVYAVPRGTQKPSKWSRPAWPAEHCLSAQGVILVADEAHLYKNYKAGRSKKITALSQFVERRWALTGTPLPNKPTDLWGVLSSFGLNWKVFGSWRKFIELFNGFPARFGGYEWGVPGPEVGERLRRVMLRRTKGQVLPDLPPKQFQTIRVDVPRSMVKALDSLWAELDVNYLIGQIRAELFNCPTDPADWYKILKMAEGDKIALDYVMGYGCPYETAKEAAKAAGIEYDDSPLRRVGVGELPLFEMISGVRADLAESRIPAMLQIVESYEDSDTPLVVFSAHRAPIDTLGERDGWATITGSTPQHVRAEIVRQFQEGELKGVGLTIGAGGVGITLTRASTMLFVDLDWTPAMNIQAEDRIHRIGQKAQSAHYIHLVSDHPLDQRVHQLLAAKMDLIRATLDNLTEAEISTVVEIKSESEAVWEARMESLRRAEEEVETRAREARDAARNEDTRSRIDHWTERYSERGGREIQSEISPERAERLRDAFGFLLSHCDGAMSEDAVGFNKPDAAIAHRLNALGLEEAEITRLLDVMLYKYRGTQLRAFNLYD